MTSNLVIKPYRKWRTLPENTRDGILLFALGTTSLITIVKMIKRKKRQEKEEKEKESEI